MQLKMQRESKVARYLKTMFGPSQTFGASRPMTTDSFQEVVSTHTNLHRP
jgi:hypothetical protein